MNEPTEMERRVAKAIEYAELHDKMNEALYRADEPPRYHYLMLASAAIRAMRPDVETMDGRTMNAMCEAFHFDGEALVQYPRDGLTNACTRAVVAYIDAASPDPAS